MAHDPATVPVLFDPIMKYFTDKHLPESLRFFADLANHLVTVLPHGPERSVALRKLLESKDAAERALL
jgi:hypothetical protein